MERWAERLPAPAAADTCCSIANTKRNTRSPKRCGNWAAFRPSSALNFTDCKPGEETAMTTMVTGETLIQGILASNIQVHEAMRKDAELIWGISRAAKTISQALGRGNRLLIIGNGGSAADAQHLAAEFVGRYRIERRGLPAVALSAKTSSATAGVDDHRVADVV